MPRSTLLEFGISCVARAANDARFIRVGRRANVFWRGLSQNVCYWLGVQVHMRHGILELVPTLGVHAPSIARVTAALSENKDAGLTPILQQKIMTLDPTSPFTYQARDIHRTEPVVAHMFSVIEQFGLPHFSAFRDPCSIAHELRAPGPRTGLPEHRMTRLPVALLVCGDRSGAIDALATLQAVVDNHRETIGGRDDAYTQYYDAFLRRTQSMIDGAPLPPKVHRQISEDEAVLQSLMSGCNPGR